MTTTHPSATVRVAIGPARLRWWRPLALLVGVAAIGGAIWLAGEEAIPRRAAAGPEGQGASSTPEGTPATKVEVVRPRRGGVQRRTTQPGSVHSFESVDLQAMISGYLKTQSVDIGSRIAKGEVLAEIDAPHEAKGVEEASAMLDQARTMVALAEARVATTEAERDTAAATVAQSRSDVARVAARRKLAEAQLARIRALFERKAVQMQLVDEQRHDRDAALAAEATAGLAVRTAEAQRGTAEAKVRQARADVDAARAAVEVAEARLAKAKVDLGYARIVAPFDGVVTHRGFHPGAFIRSAPAGGQAPLLTVMRTDRMRVVVRVPDRDVVLTDAGDPATVAIDALGGRAFPGTVARVAESEESTTRTMRVEIDLPNPEGLLRDGMYGNASITMQADSPSLTVPSACVVERSGKDRGVLRVVRDGKARRAEVALGAEDGPRVEVLSGLGPDDAVVSRADAPLEDGAPVVVESAATAAATANADARP